MVDKDLEVVHVHCVHILDVQVLLGGVEPLDAGELEVATATKEHESGPTFRVLVQLEELTDPPHIALSIDSSFTAESHVRDVIEHHEVTNVLLISHGPVVVPLGQLDRAIDSNIDVGEVVSPHAKHAPSMVSWHENFSHGIRGVVSSDNGVHESL